MVPPGAVWPFEPEAAGGIALRVDVDEQRRVAGESRAPAARLMAVVVLPTPPF